MKIAEWLNQASNEFADSMIPSARLDAEVILAHTLSKPRTWLHAHGEEELEPRRCDIANARAQLRLERVPIAYIIGHKEFYGRRFRVTPDTLIPRPESEALITLAKKYGSDARQAVDVGTGSGCLGITLKLELPDLIVTLADTSKRALIVAKQNAVTLAAPVRIIESNLLDAYPLRADIIIANLPYVNTEWSDNSPELAHEPSEALYADDQGLALIKQLIEQAPSHLAPGGLLLIEADTRQHEAIHSYAASHGFSQRETDGLACAFQLA